MRPNAGMTNRQADVDLRFAQVSPSSYWLDLALPNYSSYLSAY